MVDKKQGLNSNEDTCAICVYKLKCSKDEPCYNLNDNIQSNLISFLLLMKFPKFKP